MDTSAYREALFAKKYHPGESGEQAFKREYSYSDRSRYYRPGVRDAERSSAELTS